MIQKQAGSINETVYNHTVFCNGKWHQYLTMNNLGLLVEEIVNAHATTKYLRFNPFYSNLKEKRQVEFDDYMFYMECKNDIDGDAEKLQLEGCLGKRIQDMEEEEIRIGRIQFPLCRYDDPDTYAIKLTTYMEFLNELIPKLRKLLIKTEGFKDEELIFGEICFEINSG